MSSPPPGVRARLHSHTDGVKNSIAELDKALSSLDEALVNSSSSDHSQSDHNAASASINAAMDQRQDEQDRVGDKLDNIFSPSAYRKRLATFRVETYFAKPMEISPLLCARFGWINTSHDMLTCASPSCRAAICVSIHPALGESSTKSLALKYRQMLVTAHDCTGACPFRSDAGRWLLDEESKKQADGFAIPPYLIPMSSDFGLLENLSIGGSLSRRMLREAAVALGKHIQRPHSSEPLVYSDKVEDFFVNQLPGLAKKGDLGSVIASSLCKDLRSEDDENDSPLRNLDFHSSGRTGEEAFLDLSQNQKRDLSLLAAFGWRPSTSSSATAHPEGCSLVQCNLCLTRAYVTNDGGDHQVRQSKRQKREGDSDMLEGLRKFDVLKSHCHYCPFIADITCRSGGMAGWESTTKMLIQHLHQEENSASVSKSDDAERAYRSVRGLLQSALPSCVSMNDGA